ncbi:MAG: MlaD family protein [Bacteroidales bacterium]|jgi:phospholipid/cholesterol/gamma-HCH transport system substrate-binding protein|nr:MlaD family protein [Bacteroidales bacterium]
MKLNKETKLGIIAVLIIACFIWGYNFLKGKNILTTNDTFYAVYSNIDGLEEASPVTISGYTVGVVESIKLHKNKKDKIVVKFSLAEDLKLPHKTEAIIYPESLIAGKAIKLNFSDSKEFHLNGDTIIGILEQDLISSLSSELMPVKNKIENLVVSMDSVLAIFDNERKDNLKNSLDNLNQITNNLTVLLDSDNSKLTRILSNAESISNNLKNNNEQISNILSNFSSISDSIEQANIKSTILNANKTLAEFSKISTKINSGEGTVGMLINNDSLYINLNNLAEDLDSLIIDLNENPNRYVHFSLFGKKDKK